jgi:hypothetical protein
MSAGTRETSSLTVFISYSRDDLDFADQLDAALQLHKYNITIDRHGISGGEDWKKRLGGLVRDADTVVFVLSPSSARSEICKWEVAEAVRLGKRIIPVIWRPLEDTSPPPQLAALNYIFFYADPRLPGSGFGTGLARLVTALNTDLNWLREHTRLLQRATEWEAAGRAQSRLLFGDSIADAKAWAARRPKEAPEVTALQYDFIRASEEAEARRQNAERQQLEQMAAAQADRARALADREVAQKREAEQARRVVRRTLMGMAVAILLAAATGAAGLLAFQKQREAAVERDRARDALAQVLAERSWTAVSSGNQELAIRYALAGWRVAPTNAAYYRAPLSQAIASAVVPIARHVHEGGVTTLISSPDGGYSVSGGQDGLAVLLDASSLQTVHTFPHDGLSVTAAAIDPSGTRVLTITINGVIHIWDIKTGKKIARLGGHSGRVTDAVFSPDATRLGSSSEDMTTRLWDLSGGVEIAVFKGHEDWVSALAFSPDGRLLVTGSGDKTARIWDARTGGMTRVLAGHTGEVTALAFSPDGRLLLTGSADKTVLVWDMFDIKKEPRMLTGHLSGIHAVTFSPDGFRVYVIDFNGNAYIWDMTTPRPRIVVASTTGAEGGGFPSTVVGASWVRKRYCVFLFYFP